MHIEYKPVKGKSCTTFGRECPPHDDLQTPSGEVVHSFLPLRLSHSIPVTRRMACRVAAHFQRPKTKGSLSSGTPFSGVGALTHHDALLLRTYVTVYVRVKVTSFVRSKMEVGSLSRISTTLYPRISFGNVYSFVLSALLYSIILAHYPSATSHSDSGLHSASSEEHDALSSQQRSGISSE